MRFFNLTLKNSLTFASNTKTMQMAQEEVTEVSYCYYSQDSREIVQKFPCMEPAKFTDCDQTFWDVLPTALGRTFSDVAPGKGLNETLTQMYYYCGAGVDVLGWGWC